MALFIQNGLVVDWAAYEQRFSERAQDAGLTEIHVSHCLEYAKKLHDFGVPVIYDPAHLAQLVGYTDDYIHRASFGAEKFYRSFTVPKRAGGVRSIDEPLPSLKDIQQWILKNILYRCPPSPFAKAFVPGRSIRENARFHRGQPKVLSLDIKDFFPSIPEPRVQSLFQRMGYHRVIATVLTRLCCLRGALPQGAPTSPAISNLVATRIDRRLGTFAKRQRIRYTRYADDLTFSGQLRVTSIIRLVRSVLADEGMELNERKTRLMESHQQQEVTGIVVNAKLNVARDVRRQLRQAIYHIKQFGLDSHVMKIHETRANYVGHLLGIASHILWINPNDRDAKEAIAILRPSSHP